MRRERRWRSVRRRSLRLALAAQQIPNKVRPSPFGGNRGRMSFLDELAFGPGRNWRAWVRALLLLVVLVALAAAILYLTVAGDYAYLKASVYTGAPTGQYHAVGERLAARALKKHGLLKVVSTAGSVENVQRLAGENGHCDPAFGFVQDGVPVPEDAGIQTLGRLPQPESLILLARRGR